MSDTTVAAPPPWEAGRRPRPTWGLAEGDELAPGRTVLRRIGGGRRYEAMLVWDEHRLAVLVAKVLRPDQAREPARAAGARPRGARCCSGSPIPSSCGPSAPSATARSRTSCSSTSTGRRSTSCWRAKGRWRSSSCCRSRCTSPPRCTTWRAKAWCISTSSPRTSSWARPPRLIDLSVARTRRGRPRGCGCRSAPTASWRPSSARPTAASGRPRTSSAWQERCAPR